MANGPLALVGFGEAAQAFCEGMGAGRTTVLRSFDLKAAPGAPTRDQKQADFTRFNVQGADTNRAAVDGAAAVLSLVTAAQALAAAQTTAAAIAPGAFFFDGNSVSPKTKRVAAEAIEAAGGRYVDVAIMAPVHPALTAVPLLVGGPHAEPGAAYLRAVGFSKVRTVAGPVGAASAIKMIRSVMIKGIEALTAECLLAAVAAGVDREVIDSLDSGKGFDTWAARGDYNLDRMMVHGIRRAEEMREVVATLEELGISPEMTRGTVAWQAAIGDARLGPPPEGYKDKVAVIVKAKAAP